MSYSRVPLLVFISLIFFLWKSLVKNSSPIPSPLINQRIPSFFKIDLIHGNRLTEKMFFGHWSLLVVWSSWCTTCLSEQSFLLSLKKSSQLQLFGLNYRDNLKKARAWLKQQPNPFSQVIFDPKGQLSMDLGVYGVPESFLIDPKGIIRYKQVGCLNKNNFFSVLKEFSIEN